MIYSLISLLSAGAVLLVVKDVVKTIVRWVVAGFSATPPTAKHDPYPSWDQVKQFIKGFAQRIKILVAKGMSSEKNGTAPLNPSGQGSSADMFDAIRSGLIESYKPKLVDGAKCVTCGAIHTPISLHILEFYQAENLPLSKLLVPMSQSFETIRGSVPICTTCAPVCRQCGLPISTPWVVRIGEALQSKIPTVTIRHGNGVCRQHTHFVHLFLSLTKRVSIIDGE